MKKINEEFLHFLWKNQQLTGVQLTSPGRSVRVLDPGTHNHDAGPDFFNAKVEIDHTLWAGNVEIHINASDWIRHGHTDDPSYRSVILHVVCFNDCEISRPDGGTIPVAMLRFPGLMWDRYDRLMRSDQWIPCQEKLKDIPPLYVAQWTSSLMVQKLQEKTSLLKKNMDDLQDMYLALCTLNSFVSVKAKDKSEKDVYLDAYQQTMVHFNATGAIQQIEFLLNIRKIFQEIHENPEKKEKLMATSSLFQGLRSLLKKIFPGKTKDDEEITLDTLKKSISDLNPAVEEVRELKEGILKDYAGLI